MLEGKIRVQVVIRIGMSVQNVTTLATLLKPNMLNIDQIKKLEKLDSSDYDELLFLSYELKDTAITLAGENEKLKKEQTGYWYKVNSLVGYIEGLLQGKKFSELRDVLKEMNEFLEENKPL